MPAPPLHPRVGQLGRRGARAAAPPCAARGRNPLLDGTWGRERFVGAPDGGAGSSQHGASTVVSSWVLGAGLRLRVRHWCRRHRESCSHVMGTRRCGSAQGGGEEQRWGCWGGSALRVASSRPGGGLSAPRTPRAQQPHGCVYALLRCLRCLVISGAMLEREDTQKGVTGRGGLLE